MKRMTTFLFILSLVLSMYGQKAYELTSPNGNIKVAISVSDKIYYDITCNNEPILIQNTLLMEFEEKTLGLNPKVSGKSSQSVREEITPVIPFKYSTIQNHYNQLLLKFNGRYSVEFRTFDDGVAYRFITNLKDEEIEVKNELFQINLPEQYTLHVQQSEHLKTAYEETYEHLDPNAWNAESNKYTLLPFLLETGNGYNVLISESALTDYPCMLLNNKAGKNKVASTFAPVPLEFGEDGDRSVRLLKEANYIAKTSGKRSFPWRYFIITKDDGRILENTMTARLAEKSMLTETAWIKPGVTTREWWNGATPYGPDVKFKAGCNTDTYKYFIDFASKFGVEYVLLDEGWAADTRNAYTPNKDLDLPELIQYAKSKNVDIILWLTWLTVENNLDLFEQFAQWGIKGVKIDFMDRSDQWMVNYYEKVAALAAKHKLFVMFHGAFKPAGLEYKYPNVVTYEGLLGMEQMGRCTPDNCLYLPFMRNAVGPMDFTPGAMLNYQPDSYRAERPNSGCKGTRAYQMALYIIFETGIQMMADNPSLYYREADCAHFMADVPVVSDETISLDSKVGEYVIIAKRKGNKWYIGGITNSKEEGRTFEVTLDFLPADKTFHMTSYEDGANANHQAMHYVKNEQDVSKGQKISIKMARNGGFAAVISAEATKEAL